MQAKLKGAIWASFAGFAFAGVALVATQMATLAGTLMASHQAFAAAAATKPLLQPTAFSQNRGAISENAIRLEIRAYAARDAKQAFAKLAPATQRFFVDRTGSFARWLRTCRPCSIRGASPFSAWSRSASGLCSRCWAWTTCELAN